MSRKLFIAAGIFHPETGGPATYLYELLPELQARGWEVRVVTYGDGHITHRYPYPVTRIPRRVLPLRVMHYGLAARPLLRWADLIYIHTLDLPLLGGSASRVMKIVGDQAWERAIRKGWIPTTEDVDDFQRRRYTSTVTAQQEARSRQVRAMDAVIVPSQYLKRLVMGWGVDETRIHVIYNALPREATANRLTDTREISQRDARQQLGLSLDEPLILTAARLTAWKGVDHLIAAVRQVAGVRLLVAGDGPVRAQLEALAQQMGIPQRVTFLNIVSREKIPLYMKAADYVALYSGYEGLSHTLLESLQAGTPVIASDKGGNPEVVQHGVNGLLVPYVNIEALAAVLDAAFQPGRRAALAANVHVGMERFDFQTMVDQTAAVLESCLTKALDRF